MEVDNRKIRAFVGTFAQYVKMLRKYIYYGYWAISAIFLVLISIMIADTWDNPIGTGLVLGGLAISNIVVGMSFLYIQTSLPINFVRAISAVVHSVTLAAIAVITIDAMQAILPDESVLFPIHLTVVAKAMIFVGNIVIGIVFFTAIDFLVCLMELIHDDTQ